MLRTSITSSFPILILFSGLGMAFPFYNIWSKYRKQKADLQKLAEKKKEEGKTDFTFYQISSFEEQTKKMEYTGEDAMYDYTQVLSAVAFVALFGTVNPVPIVGLAWLAITVQHRVDAIRLCVLYQRAYPDRIKDIGVWDKMLGVLRYACVMNVIGLLSTNPRVQLAVLLGILPRNVADLAHAATNATLINHTHNATLLQEHEQEHAGAAVLLWIANQFAIVLLFSLMMFLVWLTDKVIADETAIVTREKARQAHQRAKLFDFENSTFTEKVVLTGDGNFKETSYEAISKLQPGDPLYVPPIAMC